MLLKENRELFRHNTLHSPSRFAVTQLLLRLALKLRFADLDTDDCSKTFPDIITGKIQLTFLQKLVRSCVIVKCLRKGVLKSRKMCAALRCRNIIYKAVASLIVGCLLYTSPIPRDVATSRMPSSA